MHQIKLKKRVGRWLCVASLLIAWAGGTPAARAEIEDHDIVDWRPGVPTNDATAINPYRLYVNVRDPAAPGGIRTVEVSAAFQKKQPGETDEQAKVRKANAIRDAINAKMMAEGQPQRAEVVMEEHDVIVRHELQGGRWVPVVEKRTVPVIKLPGVVRDPNAPGPQHRKRVVAGILNDPTREGTGNGVGTRRGQIVVPGGGSGGMEREQEEHGSATGLDELGELSVVTFGVMQYRDGDDPIMRVATVNPQPGQTEAQVLDDLAELLNDFWQLPVTYDPLAVLLSVSDEHLHLGDLFVWGNSDPGLAFAVSFATNVPEPATWALMALVASVILLKRLRVRAGNA